MAKPKTTHAERFALRAIHEIIFLVIMSLSLYNNQVRDELITYELMFKASKTESNT